MHVADVISIIATRFSLLDRVKEDHDTSMDQLTALLQLETRPFTLNTQYLADFKGKLLAYYKGCRQKENNGTFMGNIASFSGRSLANSVIEYSSITPQEHINQIISGLSSIGLHGINPVDLARLIPDDSSEVALEIMATTRAYFQGEIVVA